MDGFTAVAEPTRRAILDLLRAEDADVGTLVAAVGASQPLVSKHLRVLREAGAVEARVEGRRRVYRLARDPLPDVLAWVRPYAERWTRALDDLEAALDAGGPGTDPGPTTGTAETTGTTDTTDTTRENR